MKKDGACKMDGKNKKFSCARKSGKRKNNAVRDKEEELVGPLAKKKLSAEGCCRMKGKREEISREKNISMIYNIMINGLYEDTKCIFRVYRFSKSTESADLLKWF